MADAMKLLASVAQMASEAAGDDLAAVAKKAKAGDLGSDDAKTIEKIRKRIEALEAELKKAKAELAKLADKAKAK